MQSLIKQAGTLLSTIAVPDLPELILLLKEELNKKYPNTVIIANLISKDPQLLADFLDLVNTNVTAERTHIQDAKAAVNLLGLDEIYNLFVSTVISNLLAQNELEKSILSHGAKAGLAAAELSYWVYDVSRSQAYMTGLMQNIGAIYLSKLEPDLYEEMFNASLSNPISAYQNELNHYQTSHVYIGSILVKKWHIQPEIYKAILFHHDMDFAIKTVGNQTIKHLTALTILSNYIVSSTDPELYINQELREYRDAAKQVLDLPDNAIKAATAAVNKWGSQGFINASH
ncbi:HDOD domain-containing protein [Hydrogenovibrio sp. 3SP14C1]|uniref:HDOD domain-containing protein n=1 Tax=Hydrogenovibrio sp. 3SP14C1 TaxID=3038774 RepID=UPI002416A4D2|nr:HDOD domain-containing protein [Hydrogenovibrio sp. 3SP14C1]MDG4812354.1 HDOD domain-containing protein [Hydrogenovibrio sp. 3SP14C1]